MNMPEKLIKNGQLVMASTHIGCLTDVPLRTLEGIREADLLVFEEDRPARQLLKAAGIHKSYLKINEHPDPEVMSLIKQAFIEGKKILYCSDQGCPSFADPGQKVLGMAYKYKARVRIIPGPSSLTAAISACPLPLKDFYYAGFLPQKTQERTVKLDELLAMQTEIVLLETPYRLVNLLELFATSLNKQQRVFLAMSAGNEDEEYHLAQASELFKFFSRQPKNKKPFVAVIFNR